MEQTRVPAYKRIVPRPFLLLIGVGLVTAIVVGSFLPGPTKIRLGTDPYRPHANISFQHRMYHFAMFGSTALVFLLRAWGIRREITTAVLVFALGLLIEIAQHLGGFSEVMEWWDVLDDLYAVTASFLLIQMANIAARR